MLIVIFWLILSFIAGAAGANKSIGFWGAFFLSLILSPLIGFIIVAFSSSQDSSDDDIGGITFTIDHTTQTGTIGLLDVKSYAGSLNITISNDFELGLLTKQLFAENYNYATITDCAPPDEQGIIHFKFKYRDQ